MIMLCWFYCIPFAKFLYFATAPLFLVFSLFMLKRATRAGRPFLKKLAFSFITLSVMKIFLFDVRALKQDIICSMDVEACTQKTMDMVDLVSLGLLFVSLYLIYHYYGVFMRIKTKKPQTPEQAHVPLWANIAMGMVMLMVVWQLAPWIGYLTIGSIPSVFLAMPWQFLAMLNLGLLLVAFWRAENCVWDYDVAHKKTMGHLNKTWTAKDTLWTAVFIYLITLGLSYVAHDVLTTGMQRVPPQQSSQARE